MELVKRKFLNIGSAYGINVCVDAVCIKGEDPESPKFLYNDRPQKRGEYYKCIFCRFEHKPSMCDRFACMRSERNDGKTVFFSRV